LEFSGALANTYSGLTTVSAGTLLLDKTSGVNAIAGDLTISGGTVLLGAANEIADASLVTLASGTFNMSGFNEEVSALAFNGGTLTQGGGVLSLASSGTALTMRNTTIAGAVSLTGGGGVVFDATNNGTAVISGSLDIASSITTFDIGNGTAA